MLLATIASVLLYIQIQSKPLLYVYKHEEKNSLEEKLWSEKKRWNEYIIYWWYFHHVFHSTQLNTYSECILYRSDTMYVYGDLLFCQYFLLIVVLFIVSAHLLRDEHCALCTQVCLLNGEQDVFKWRFKGFLRLALKGCISLHYTFFFWHAPNTFCIFFFIFFRLFSRVLKTFLRIFFYIFVFSKIADKVHTKYLILKKIVLQVKSIIAFAFSLKLTPVCILNSMGNCCVLEETKQ